jgi:hypothetical protein
MLPALRRSSPVLLYIINYFDQSKCKFIAEGRLSLSEVTAGSIERTVQCLSTPLELPESGRTLFLSAENVIETKEGLNLILVFFTGFNIFNLTQCPVKLLSGSSI